MKKLSMIEKCKLIATVLKSDLTPEEKAEKLSILKTIMNLRLLQNDFS